MKRNEAGFKVKVLIISLGMVLLQLSVSLAADVPNKFKDGETASAEKVNANFKDLSDRAFEKSGSHINYGAGNVGIGTASPSARLDVIAVDGVGIKSSLTKDAGGSGSNNVTGILVETNYSGTGGGDNTVYGLHVKTNNVATGGSNNNFATAIFEGGNVGIGTTNPQTKLDVLGSFIRKIAHATGNGPDDTTDIGQITSRVLVFTKTRPETKIRIGYTDNLRVRNPGTACAWEIRVDGASCPDQKLIYHYYASGNDDTHRSRAVTGYCGGLDKGAHTIQVWVSNAIVVSGITTPADCQTGLWGSTWVLEAEEVY